MTEPHKRESDQPGLPTQETSGAGLQARPSASCEPYAGQQTVWLSVAGLLIPLLLIVIPLIVGHPANAAGTFDFTPMYVLFTHTPRPIMGPPATSSSFTMATLPFMNDVRQPRTGNFDPAQVALGRVTYAQWCVTCHGAQGEGLDAWRHTWPPDKQTCTNSKCHGRNHPDDGFEMLKVPPPLMPSDALRTYQNAFQLFYYVRSTMPWQGPGTLSDEEYWAIVAYIADQRGSDASKQVVNATNAEKVSLHPG